MKFTTTDNDRGQVGIGTLIVFIAMVLVAAIAAGVLVDTAGFLQSKAQQTGEDSTAKVTNRVEVVDTYGEVRVLEYDDLENSPLMQESNNTGNWYIDDGAHSTAQGSDTKTNDAARVYDLNFVLMRSAGSGDIQLEKVVLMWQGPDGAEEFTLDEAGDDAVTITPIEGASDNVLSDQKDRARLTLRLDPRDADQDGTKDRPVLDALAPGESVTVKFTTVSGATVRQTVTMPSTMPNSNGAVIDL